MNFPKRYSPEINSSKKVIQMKSVFVEEDIKFRIMLCLRYDQSQPFYNS